MRRTFVVLLTVFAALAEMAPPSSACTCVPSTDLYSEYVSSDAVFLGEVTEMSNAGGYPSNLLVTFRVENRWKGDVPGTAQLLTADNGASCGYHFIVGTRYLVFAYLGTDLVLRTSLCSRTHEALPADPDVILLDAGPIPPPAPPQFSLAMSPNPSRGNTRLTWTVPAHLGESAPARLEVLDFQGRSLATLANGPAVPGPHESSWDGRDSHGRVVPAGVYWVRFTCAAQVTSRRLVRIVGRP